MEAQESGADRRSLMQQLFIRHERAIRAFAFGITRDFPATDDVVQETFLTVTAKATQFTPGTDFVAGACMIARLKVLECRRAADLIPQHLTAAGREVTTKRPGGQTRRDSASTPEKRPFRG